MPHEQSSGDRTVAAGRAHRYSDPLRRSVRECCGTYRALSALCLRVQWCLRGLKMSSGAYQLLKLRLSVDSTHTRFRQNTLARRHTDKDR